MTDTTTDAKKVAEDVRTKKNVIVTGGNQGIGLQTATKLSEQGYVVTISARSDARGKEAVEKIMKAVPGAKVDYLVMDLLSLDSVRAFAKSFNDRGVPLHILINNAGVILENFALTKDGVESQWQVNHLSHFLLTYLLWPRLLEAGREREATGGGARVINVSSEGHRYYDKPFDLDAVTKVDTAYDSIQAYARTKLANVWFTRGLEHRLKKKGVTFFCLHPGVVATNMMDVAQPMMKDSGVDFSKAIPADAGCKTSVYLATTPGIEKYSGGYFDDSKLTTPSELAQSQQEEDKLWAGSLQLLGLTPEDFA